MVSSNEKKPGSWGRAGEVKHLMTTKAEDEIRQAHQRSRSPMHNEDLPIADANNEDLPFANALK